MLNGRLSTMLAKIGILIVMYWLIFGLIVFPFIDVCLEICKDNGWPWQWDDDIYDDIEDGFFYGCNFLSFLFGVYLVYA